MIRVKHARNIVPGDWLMLGGSVQGVLQIAVGLEFPPHTERHVSILLQDERKLILAEDALVRVEGNTEPTWVDYAQIGPAQFVPPHSHLQMLLQCRGWVMGKGPTFTKDGMRIATKEFFDIPESEIIRDAPTACILLENRADLLKPWVPKQGGG